MRVILALLVVTLAGCASIIDEHSQSIKVETVDHQQPVNGADCELTNDKGTWPVTTPGSVVVHKSYTDLLVKCNKSGFIPASRGFSSKSGGSPWGNVLVGGGIGWFIDKSSGAGFNYPPLLTIDLTADAQSAKKLMPTQNDQSRKIDTDTKTQSEMKK